MVICLERVADLHMAMLVPPLTLLFLAGTNKTVTTVTGILSLIHNQKHDKQHLFTMTILPCLSIKFQARLIVEIII